MTTDIHWFSHGYSAKFAQLEAALRHSQNAVYLLSFSWMVIYNTRIAT
jgi:hypothetical protein